MFDQTASNVPSYHTLDEIRLRKAQLLTDINKDNNRMGKLWNNVFHKPKDNATPTQRFSSVMNTGAGIVDSLILGWKLYRKFGGGGKSNSKFHFFGKKK